MDTGNINQAQICFTAIDMMVSSIGFDTDPSKEKDQYRLVLGSNVKHCMMALAPSPHIKLEHPQLTIVPEIESILGITVITARDAWTIMLRDESAYRNDVYKAMASIIQVQ